uniref:G-protein coupled receptors family 3 profile domain-containing protein n=1 Tax=Sphenodon punctatus TaxID=8508 RepID=A0A8D0GC69_SPHPU
MIQKSYQDFFFNIDPAYYFLCDTCAAWGIGIETLAAAGILTTLVLLLAFFVLSCKVQDSNKRNMVPVQFIFLLSNLGIFSLTFAFIIQLNKTTGPTRFFLFGVLFALCFSCLLTHAFNLIKLVRGKIPISWPAMLVYIVGFTCIQVIIAVKYVAITMGRDAIDFTRMERAQRNKDLVMLLMYVLLLMALTFVSSMFTSCGPYRGWKRHGAHICTTILFSIAIWTAWISVLMRGIPTQSNQSRWDDPLFSIVLVANGWVFLMMYMVPEMCFLTVPRQCAIKRNVQACSFPTISPAVGQDNREGGKSHLCS